jgi:hypothetical protein
MEKSAKLHNFIRNMKNLSFEKTGNPGTVKNEMGLSILKREHAFMYSAYCIDVWGGGRVPRERTSSRIAVFRETDRPNTLAV